MRSDRELAPKEALARAEALCARSEQCEWEIREKLRRWGVDPSAHDGIIDSLVERRFVDDARYAGAYVRAKQRGNRWGRWKIAAGLAAKRVAKLLVERALAEVTPGEWLSAAVGLARAKVRTLEDPGSYESRMKLARFLMGRGYEASVVERAVAAALRPRDDEADEDEDV